MIGSLIKGAVIESFLDNVGGGGNKPNKNVVLDSADFPQAAPIDYTPFVLLAAAFLAATVFLITKNA